ncbi:MAG: hypothetical protein WC734_05575 [Patescibacteria group bacterium]|jgi:hypothetical protein
MANLRPNEKEKAFLNLAYNRFYDIFEEIEKDDFWQKEDWHRFTKIRDAFLIYTELLNYEPIQWIIEQIRKHRPPMEAEIGSDLFKFVRNIISHFPFYERWNDVWVSKDLVNWYKDGQSIDKFIEKYKNHPEVKYRVWQPKKKLMTYLSINFPQKYQSDTKLYLRELLTEKEGIIFSMTFMKQILDIQVEEMKVPN